MLLMALTALVAPSIVLCAYMEPPPWSIHRASDYQETTRPTQELGLETFLKYDTSLLQERFKGDHKKAKKWIRGVVGVATTILLQLDIPVRLTPVGDIEYIKETLSPDHQTLKRLSGLRRKKLTSYFCGNGTGGNLGLAYFHSACNNLGAALNVNAYSVVSGDDVTIGGRTLAQQLGHNMGMGLDSDVPCEKPWGYMDPTINEESSWKGFWTNCSNKEFENYYMDGIGACLKENGNFIGADEDEDSLYPTHDEPTTKGSLKSTTNDNDNDNNGGNDDNDNDNKDGNDEKDNDSGDNTDGSDEKDIDSDDNKDVNDEKDNDSNDNQDGNNDNDDDGDNNDGNDEKDDDPSDNQDGNDEKDDEKDDNKDGNDEKDDDSDDNKDGNDENYDDSDENKDGNGEKDKDSNDNTNYNDENDTDSNDNKDVNDEKDNDSEDSEDGNDEQDNDSIDISEYQSGEDCDESVFDCNYYDQNGEECDINEDGYCDDDEDELSGNDYEDVNVPSELINLGVASGCNTGFPFWLPCIVFG